MRTRVCHRAQTDSEFTILMLILTSHGYPTDSDIIKLALLPYIYLKFIITNSNKYTVHWETLTKGKFEEFDKSGLNCQTKILKFKP